MRRILSLLVVVTLLMTPVIAAESNIGESESDSSGFNSRSNVLMEMTSGTVLKEKNKDASIPIASVTKIMTLLLCYDAIRDGRINWQDQVTVSEHAASMGGSQVFMEVGEQQTVKDMIKCISIASANDAAVAMAEHIAGSETGFVDLMNKKATELGMKDTVFKNACGLNIEGHVSSAYDVALMSRALMLEYPEVSVTSTTWMDTIVHKTRKGESEFGLTNTNKMLKWYSGITGLKTGYTPEAKHCVSATAERNDLKLIAVVLGGEDSKLRFREAGELLDYGFSNFEIKKGPQVGDVVAQVSIKKGVKENVNATVKDSLATVVNKNEKVTDYEYQIEPNEEIVAPISQGQELGSVVYLLNGVEIGKGTLVSLENIEKAGIISRIKNLVSKKEEVTEEVTEESKEIIEKTAEKN